MRKSSTGKITIAAVAKLQPGETLNDDKLAGFSVRRQRTKAVYSLRGRFNRQRIRLTIGWEGRFTPDEARKDAKRLIGLLASGIDPRVQSSDHMTFAEAAKAFTEHAYAKRAKGTARGYDGHFKRHLIPKLGFQRFESVSPATLAKLHLKLRDQPVLANRVLDTASSLYGWAARKTLCTFPCPRKPISRTALCRVSLG